MTTEEFLDISRSVGWHYRLVCEFVEKHRLCPTKLRQFTLKAKRMPVTVPEFAELAIPDTAEAYAVFGINPQSKEHIKEVEKRLMAYLVRNNPSIAYRRLDPSLIWRSINKAPMGGDDKAILALSSLLNRMLLY